MQGDHLEAAQKNVKNYEKHNKLVRGHILNHMPNNLFDLYIFRTSLQNQFGSLWRRSMVLMMLATESMLLVNGCNSKWSMTNLSWIKFTSTRTWLLMSLMKA